MHRVEQWRNQEVEINHFPCKLHIGYCTAKTGCFAHRHISFPALIRRFCYQSNEWVTMGSAQSEQSCLIQEPRNTWRPNSEECFQRTPTFISADYERTPSRCTACVRLHITQFDSRPQCYPLETTRGERKSQY